ncbi:flavodoxin domain-containing protein [Pseudoalteromonas sp. BDTF-M6]|uniref:flavodoxin domain-containing protein n=1 Tax=Pseudoalteromonas sp. BDTF-M6 TaxID=2796132 RepID=UPI001BB0A42D|nr:flavodoxin domain-containing protein [Pseudoalteromonas sp. BDTF-M6]MBS3798614.1 flavodoxin domain-containing protein [Pseudoalteromonas sp. BDTF-M6]
MATISIFYGSVYGAAERLAETLCAHINELGSNAKLVDNPQVEDIIAAEQILVVTSTTGQGDLPDNILPLYLGLQEQFPLLGAKPCAVIALGDSSYGETFCGGGRQFEELLIELQGKIIQPRLDIDAMVDFDPGPVALPWVERLVAQS